MSRQDWDMTSGDRKYGGRTQADRVADRREKILRAAVTLYGRVGREGASVSAICAEAGLTTRYFYESFPSHDILFLAVFRGVSAHLLSDLHAARDEGDDPVAAFFAALAGHVGLAGLFLADLDHQDAAVRLAARQWEGELAAILVPEGADMLAVAGALGALFRVARAWVQGECAEPLEQVTATARRFLVSARG